MDLPRTRLTAVVERALFVVLLAAVAIPVYAPSLSRFFASDQIVYFAELNGDRSLAAGLRLYDYSLTHKYDKGDEALFRPLLFALLALENTLFGYDYTLWNLFNLVLHLLVAYLLYELLRTLAPPVWAAAGALLFAVNRAQVEMVMWNHLSGYLLAFASLLLALIALRKLAETPARFWLAVYGLAITVTMFSYEAGVFLAILAPAYLYCHLRHRADIPRGAFAIAMALPLVLFAGLYAGHVLQTQRLFWVDRQAAGGHRIVSLLAQMGECLWVWTAEAVNPWRSQVVQQPLVRFLFVPRSGAGQVSINLAVLILLGGFSAAVAAGVHARNLRGRLPFLAVVTLMLLAYAALVNLGRSNAMAITYYLYPVCLLGTVLVFTLVDFERLSRARQLLAGGVIALFIAANAVVTHGVSRAVATANAACNTYYAMVDEFIRQHCHEPDFSFAPHDVPPAIDPPVALNIGYPDRPTGRLQTHVSGLLYLKYYNPTNAKYYISFDPRAVSRK
jgi:hypothetical protein